MRRLIDRLHRNDREQGSTLVELAVVGAMFLLVGALLVGQLDAVTRASSTNEHHGENLLEARTMINRVGKVLRAAAKPGGAVSPFAYVAPNRVAFYVSDGTDPALVDYSIDAGGRLIETRTTSDGADPPAYPPENAAVRVVGATVINDTANPMFRYFDDNPGTEVSVPATGLSWTDEADRADLLMIHAVEVNVTVAQGSVFEGEPTTLMNVIRLANVYFHDADPTR